MANHDFDYASSNIPYSCFHAFLFLSLGLLLFLDSISSWPGMYTLVFAPRLTH